MKPRQTLAERQAEVVAALVGGGTPAGFDATRLGAARDALLRKRAGEVAQVWPALAASFGPTWSTVFAAWATRSWSAGRPPSGSLRDGWDLAREYSHTLSPPAAQELADREAHLHYDGTTTPHPRRPPTLLRRIATRIATRQTRDHG